MKIAPNLMDLVVDTKELSVYPDNSRQGDIGAISVSLEEHGQYKPIIVNKRNNQILAGNHTYLAAVQLNWKKIACTYVDVDDEEAKRIVLVDNKTTDLASYDYNSLVESLEELANTEKGLAGTGFELDDLDELTEMVNQERLKLESTEVFSDYINSLNANEPEYLGSNESGELYYKLNYAVSKEQREIIMKAINNAKELFETDNSIEALVNLCGSWSENMKVG